MTLTVRSATVTGATTKGSPLTHAELDENFNHLSQSANHSFTQSGSGAAESVQTALRRLPHSAQYSTLGDYETARDALTGIQGLAPEIEIAPSASGTSSLFPITIKTGDSTNADFNFAISDVTNSGTVNTGLSFGYNCAPSASRRDSSEPAWMLTFESDYNDGSDRYMELHFQGVHADGTSFRNWSWQVSRSTKTTDGSIAADSFSVLDRTRTNQAFKFNGISTTAGEFLVLDGSVINKEPNNEQWLSQQNAAGNAYVELVRLNASNEVLLAPAGGVTKAGGALYTPSGISSGGATNLDIGSTGGTQVRINHVASAVNRVELQGAATGGGVRVLAAGSDTDVTLNLITQNAGVHRFFTAGTSAQQFQVNHVASASRYLRVSGSNGGHPVLDTNNASSFIAFGRSIVMTSQPSWFIQEESDSDPTATELDADDSVAIYNKNDKFVIAYNNGGTITYISIPLDGSTTTWTHSTSAP